MKKTYVKPALMLESFVLSQSIAAKCGVPGGGSDMGKPGFGDKTSCGWIMGDVTIWLDTMEVCNFHVGPDEPVGSVCYNTPTGDFTIFGS